MVGQILEKSLCGCSLRTASKIVGWMGLVGYGTFSLIVTILLVKHILAGEKVYSILFILIILGLPLFVTGYHALLLFGVQKRRPGFLLPYMIFTMLHVLGGLVWIGVSIKNQQYQQYDGFLFPLKAVHDIYCLLLVTSYYFQLRIINQAAAAV